MKNSWKKSLLMLEKKTWVEKLLEKYPDCPNPINYPKSAVYYLTIKKHYEK